MWFRSVSLSFIRPLYLCLTSNASVSCCFLTVGRAKGRGGRTPGPQALAAETPVTVEERQTFQELLTQMNMDAHFQVPTRICACIHASCMCFGAFLLKRGISPKWLLRDPFVEGVVAANLQQLLAGSSLHVEHACRHCLKFGV